MSSSIELLSLNELNIRRENLIQLLKKVDEEIEMRKEKKLAVDNKSSPISEISSQDQNNLCSIPNSTGELEKKKIKINIKIKKIEII
jgi:hypothetical protein